jgi:hypothetical protein
VTGNRRKRRAAGAPSATAAPPKAETASPRPPAWRNGPGLRALAWSLLAAGLVLVATVDERSLGYVSDERQLTFTSVALAEYGEIGITRGQPFTVHRPEGDAIAPYGLGAPLVFSLASRLAFPFEASFGIASSQFLYALLQCLLVLASALAAGLLVWGWSGSPQGIAIAVLGTAAASPLWPYASTLYSEPLQALTLVGTLALAAAAVRAPDGRRALVLAAAAGAAAGCAVLTKSQALLSLPFVLLPLALDRCDGSRRRRLAAAAAALAPVLALWAGLEVHRFGRLLASYEGQGFTHPLLDGFWRLTVGPNKGLLLYFPLSLLAGVGLWRLGKERGTRGSSLGIAGAAASLLLLVSAWWAWDGTVGWGPRLLVPLVPLLAAAAGAAAVGQTASRVGWGLLAAGTTLNCLGVLQTDSSFQRYLRWAEPVPVSEARAATLPPGFVSRGPDGKPRVAALHEVSVRPGLSPFRVHAWLLGVRMAGTPEQIDESLLAPPWGDPRPRNADAFLRDPIPDLRSPFRWRHAFSVLLAERGARDREYYSAWAYAVVDQILRAMDTGRVDRAVELSERLYTRVAPSAFPAALHAEALRLANRRESLAAFLGSLPRPFLSSPRLGVVLALDARDRGDETRARRILESVFASQPLPAIRLALDRSVADWPGTFKGIWGEGKSYDVVVVPGNDPGGP